jgi:hypothetical protein
VDGEASVVHTGEWVLLYVEPFQHCLSGSGERALGPYKVFESMTVLPGATQPLP